MLLLCVYGPERPVGAQPGIVDAWEPLNGVPRLPGGRYDDIAFATESIGFVVGGSGRVYRTTDAGETWSIVASLNAYLRSAGFASATKGWIGTLDNEQALLETLDGGSTWTNITARIAGPSPTGICGIWVVDEQVAYAVGRFDGPPIVIKTVNGGQTWTASDLSSLGIGTLIDVFFFDALNGVAVGGTRRDLTGDAVVVGTNDGGVTWSIRHRTTVEQGIGGEWGWKISFPSPDIGYISVEYPFANDTGAEAKVLKTTDAGVTWEPLAVTGSTRPAGLQGIGFIDADTGWVGGRGTSSFTDDGGETWTQVVDPDGRLNRIRVVNDSLAFALGSQVYRYRRASVPTPIESPLPLPEVFVLDQNYPNPFTESTTIRYTLHRDTYVRVRVIDALGQDLRVLADAYQGMGVHDIRWDGRDASGRRVAAGVYMYLIDIGDATEMKTMVALGRPE
ncbi:MAG: T9SS type A sorting domain-containing protein [Rhodothermales bacterium]|nr:T9SS type A sorting domain-containing protein [Rhodothermales bacterium]